MPDLTAFLFSLAAVLSIVYLVGFCYRCTGWVKSAVKTAATALLALAAVAAAAPFPLVGGLLLGALGDFLLSRDGQRAFLSGLVAFAVAHVAYLALFIRFGDAGLEPLLTADRAGAALVLLGFGGLMARLLWRTTGPLRGPVTVYLAVILAMGLGALSMPQHVIAMTGALLFIASDAALASELFLLPPEHRFRRPAPFVVWSLYWLAQALFLLAWLPG